MLKYGRHPGHDVGIERPFPEGVHQDLIRKLFFPGQGHIHLAQEGRKLDAFSCSSDTRTNEITRGGRELRVSSNDDYQNAASYAMIACLGGYTRSMRTKLRDQSIHQGRGVTEVLEGDSPVRTDTRTHRLYTFHIFLATST